jgi:hypothetical protein
VPSFSSRSPGAIWLAPSRDARYDDDVTASSALRALSKFFKGIHEEGCDRKDIIVLDVGNWEC